MDTLIARRRAFFSWLDVLAASSQRTIAASRQLLAETDPIVRIVATAALQRAASRAAASTDSLTPTDA